MFLVTIFFVIENRVDILQGLAETKGGFGNLEVRQAAVLLVLVSSPA